VHFLYVTFVALVTDARLRPAMAMDDEYLLFQSEDFVDPAASK
jgi:hypothetical protein